MSFGKRVERQLLKFLGSAEGLALIEALSGDMAAQPVLKKALKGLPRFVEDVDKTYSQLEDRLALAVRNLEVSSSELTSANQNINSMLDSLGQGFLTFDRNGICSSTYSKACETLLQTSPAGKNVFDILPLDADSKLLLRQWTQLAFEDRIDFSDLEPLAPDRAKTPCGAAIEFKYRLIRNIDEAVERIVLIVTDQTLVERATTLANAKSRFADRIVKLLTEKRYFAKFVKYFREVESEYRNLRPALNDQERLTFLRQIHTLKGTAGAFLMDELQNKLHDLESKMQSQGALQPAQLVEEMHSLNSLFETFLNTCAAVADPEIEYADDQKSISRAAAKNFYQKLVTEQSPYAEEFYNNFIAEDIATAVHYLQGQISELAIRLRKPMRPLVIEGPIVKLDLAVFENLFASFIHLIRNSMDHGIEPADLRVARRKKTEGQIRVRFEATLSEIQIFVEDDGGGLDPVALAARCKAMGIAPGQTPQEIYQCVFNDGFSSAKEVSDLSGRGIGMSAVREEARKLGGEAWIESTPGQFCRTCIRIPWNREQRKLGPRLRQIA